MDYLLDTHTLLWVLFDPGKLSAKTRAIVEDPLNTIFVCPISYWEISLKCGLGKLTLPGTDPSEIPAAASKQGLSQSPVTSEILSTFHNLPPNPDHRDPFDRLIIWQAIQQNLTLLTKDRALENYIAHGLKTVR